MNKIKQTLQANATTILAYENFKVDITKYHNKRIQDFEVEKALKLEKLQNKIYFKTIKKDRLIEQAQKNKVLYENQYHAKLKALKVEFEDLKVDKTTYDQKVKNLQEKYEGGKFFAKECATKVAKINADYKTYKANHTKKEETLKADLTSYGKNFYEREHNLKNESLADLESKKNLILKLNNDNVLAINEQIKTFKQDIKSQKAREKQKYDAKEIGVHSYNKALLKLDDKVLKYQQKLAAKQVKFKPLVLNKQILATKFNRLLNENSDETFLPGVIRQIGDFISKNKIIFIVLILLFYTSLMNRNFWSFNSLKITMRGNSEVLVMALAITMVILTGGIDLSVGSNMAFSGVTMLALAENGMNMSLAIMIGILVATLIGLTQGVLIGYGRMVPFVVTLGGLLSLRGAAILYADSKPILARGDAQKTLAGLANNEFLGLNVQIWIVLVSLLVFFLVLKFTVFGRQIYAVGSNRRAAFLSGVRDKNVEMSVYAISGMMAGLAGMLIAARTQSIQPSQGQAWELKAIAAVVIGGTALTGGRGGVIGTFVGWIILSMMPTLFTTLGYSSQIEKVATGIIIIVAVLFNNNLDFRGGFSAIKIRLTRLFKQYFTMRRI